jgi:type I restriction enzyme S subunit
MQSGFASGKRDENGILQLRMNNIGSNGRVILDTYLKVPIPENINNYLLEYGDVLFNNTNSVDLIGKTAIFKNECDHCTFSNHITRLKTDVNKALPEWLFYCLIQKWRQGYFRTICQRHVGQAGITSEDLKGILIPKPSIIEQKKMVYMLTYCEKKLDYEYKQKISLKKIKKGLMQVLLTGKVRVKVDADAQP